MRANQFCTLTRTEEAKIWRWQNEFKFPILVAKAAVHSKVAFLLILIYCLVYFDCLWGFCVCPCFVMHYSVYFLVLQSS